MIKIERLTRRYGDFTAVNDVGFQIQNGEVVGLLGHNGAGKTTIMKMITGYLEPTSGRIVVDGLEVGSNSREVRKRIGYLPENCPVWPEMTVIEHLDYMAGLNGVADDKRNAAVATAIRRTALETRATAVIQTLSRGYRQRVGVARAILHDPDIVILDEPTNGLDPTQIRHMRDLIRELARNATVIVSTHVLQEVQAVCERALIMRAGELVVDARIDELRRSNGILVTAGKEAGAALAGVSGVANVTALREENGRHYYKLDAPTEVAPAVADALGRNGIALFALQPGRRDLETVFAEVNGETVND